MKYSIRYTLKHSHLIDTNILLQRLKYNLHAILETTLRYRTVVDNHLSSISVSLTGIMRHFIENKKEIILP